MPYFKNEQGAKGYVNDEEIMTRLEKAGHIRLEGKELFLRIVVEVFKKWGIPAVVSLVVFHFTGEFALSIVSLYVMQQILN